MATPLRKNRDFQLLWAGQAVSVLGSRVSQIAYPLLVLVMTGSPGIAGLVGFIGTLPYILFQLPAGAVMDRVNRRRLMIACDIVRLVALGSIPLAAWLGRLSIAQVTIVAFTEGTMFVFFRLGEVAAIRIVVPPEQHPAALSQNEARLRAATLLGNPIGGLLFDAGRTVPFLADALTYLASLVTLLLIRTPFEETRTQQRRNVLSEIKEGITWLWGQHYILIVNLAASATNGLIQVVILVVIVAERERGASGTLIGLILGGFGIGGLAGALSGGRIARRLRPNSVVLTTLWIWATLTAAVGVVSNPIVLGALLASLAFMGAVWNIATGTIYYRLVPDRLIARVSSVGSLTAFGALPLGSLAGGLLIQWFGPRMAGLIAGAGMLVIALLTTAAPSVRHGPAALAAE
ncbi:MAG: MFS transporter [Chloroflexi bacterium]|nr:MAG: MFS transporter [Chloroflexota bacterium]